MSERVGKGVRIAGGFLRWFKKCFGKPLGNLSGWEEGKNNRLEILECAQRLSG